MGSYIFHCVQKVTLFLVTNTQLNSFRIPRSFATSVYPYTLIYAQLLQVFPSINFFPANVYMLYIYILWNIIIIITMAGYVYISSHSNNDNNVS